MAKRKRSSGTTSLGTPESGGKRRRGEPATTPHPHGNVDPERLYKVRSLLEQRDDEYLIDWEDDEETGEEFEPTWEHKSNANRAAVEEFEARRKAEREAAVAAATPAPEPAPVKRGRGRPPKPRPDSPAPEPAPVKRGPGRPPKPRPDSTGKRPRGRPRKHPITVPQEPVPQSSSTGPQHSSPPLVKPPPLRNRKVVESSSPARTQATKSGPQPGPAPSSSVDDAEAQREIAESDTDNDPLEGDNEDEDDFAKVPAQVQLSNPPSSFLAGAYAKVDSQASSSSKTQSTQDLIDTFENENPAPPTQSQVASTQSRSGTSLVIPDSQSQLLDGESSSFKGFSPEPDSRRPSTAQSETEPVADTTAGISEVQRTPGTEFPDSPHSDQGNSTQDLIESQFAFASAQHGRVQASSGVLEEDEGLDTDIQRGEEARDSSARGRPEDPVTTGLQPGSPEKSERTSGSVPGASQHEVPQHSGKSTSPGNTQQTQQSATSTSRNTQTQQSVVYGEDAQRPIVVSSNEEQSQSPYSSLNRSTQESRSSHYRPPPAGQKTPRSSAVHPANSAAKRSTQPSTTSSTGFLPFTSRQSESQSQEQPLRQRPEPSTQGSSPFQTQIRPPLEGLSTNRGPKKSAGTTESAPKSHPQPTPRTSLESSLFPLAPSQSLGFVGESAPPHFGTPEDMAKTPSPKETLLQIQNNGQPASSLPPLISAEVTAAQRARLSLPPEGGRSPSMVPALEPSPEVTKEEMNTSERYETLVPQAQGSSSRDQSHNTNGESASRPVQEPEADPEIANVHEVPVGLFGIQRDSYLQNLWLHDEMIKKFLEERDPSESLLKQADGLFDRLRSIVMHPDLVNPEALTQVSTPERQAQWDCDASAKFRFLREFIDNLAERSFHIAVIVQGQQVAEMLEMFLKGIRVSCKKSYASTQQQPEQESSARSAVRATIVGLDQEAVDIEPADIVVAMDGLVQYQHPTVRAYRQHKRQAGMSWANDWAGLYILIAPRTIEHIERSILPSLSRKARARTLLTAINQFHDHFSKKGDGKGQLSLLKQAAQDVVDYLEDPEAEWPLDPLSVIENLDSQTDTDGVSGHDHSSSNPQESNSSTKRPLDNVDDAASSGDASKRPRLDSDAQTMPATINPQDIDITHVSDSLGQGTQSNLLSVNEMYVADQPTATEEHLHEVFEEQQIRLEEHVKALEDLQYRHEAQRVELVQVQRERDGATATASAAIERMRVTETNSSTLRAERTQLKEKLEEANKKLLDHSVPERAEFEALRLELEQALAEREKAEKRAQAAQKELEYSREMYQDCSNRARDLAVEKAELEKELVVASTRAEGEAARARQVSQDNRYKLLERENAKLKAILRDRDAGLKFRDEEITRLKEATRGRMGTRQSSVPRSPRVGSPIKGRVGAGSRQASPAAGDVRGGRGGHPLRRSD